jgi:hypothetical protein
MIGAAIHGINESGDKADDAAYTAADFVDEEYIHNRRFRQVCP